MKGAMKSVNKTMKKVMKNKMLMYGALAVVIGLLVVGLMIMKKKREGFKTKSDFNQEMTITEACKAGYDACIKAGDNNKGSGQGGGDPSVQKNSMNESTNDPISDPISDPMNTSLTTSLTTPMNEPTMNQQ
jgi:hypothetical protein